MVAGYYMQYLLQYAYVHRSRNDITCTCRFCGAVSDTTCKHCKLARICSQCSPSGRCADTCVGPQRRKFPVSSRNSSLLLCQATLRAAQVVAGTFKPVKGTAMGDKSKAKSLEPSIRISCTQKSANRHITPLLDKLPSRSPLRAVKYQLPYSKVPAAISTMAAQVAQKARGAACHRLQLHFMVSFFSFLARNVDA